jgi:hypothetical protein
MHIAPQLAALTAIALTFSMVMTSCGEDARSSEPTELVLPTPTPTPSTNVGKATNQTPSPSPTQTVERSPCTAPAGFAFPLVEIEDVITLLNSMPKPIDIPCFLDVLPRPLAVNATESQLSVQPALGAASPRIFLFFEDLIVTFAVQGEGAKTVEFSYLLSDKTSVKGELRFPVDDTLTVDAPYREIVDSSGDFTRCSACHSGEEAAPPRFGPYAFSSKAIKPFANRNVSKTQLDALHKSCAGKRDFRCDIINALFGGGTVETREFPAGMSNFF